MRINYSSSEENNIKNYENFKFNTFEEDGYYIKNYLFDDICEDAEAKEIRAEYVLEKFDWTKIDEIIDYWIKKLRLGGKLVIIGTELYTLAKAITTRNLNITEINQALFSNEKKSILSIFHLESSLLQRGLKINQKRIDGFTYCITAERVK